MGAGIDRTDCQIDEIANGRYDAKGDSKARRCLRAHETSPSEEATKELHPKHSNSPFCLSWHSAFCSMFETPSCRRRVVHYSLMEILGSAIPWCRRRMAQKLPNAQIWIRRTGHPSWQCHPSSTTAHVVEWILPHSAPLARNRFCPLELSSSSSS